MKTIYTILLFIICSTAHADVLTFVADSFCPYSCENKSDQGVMVDIVRTIFESKGHKIIYRVVPWSRAMKEVTAGTYTGVLGTIKSDSLDFYYPEEEVSAYTACFYVKNGNPWRFNNIDSLNNVSLGLIQDYGYEVISKKFNDYIKTNKSKHQYVTSYMGTTQNFLKLANNRFDAMIAVKSVANYLLTKNNMANIISEAGCFNKELLVYVGFAPSNPNSKKYAELFDQGIKVLRNSGQLETILSNYGMTDWKN